MRNLFIFLLIGLASCGSKNGEEFFKVDGLVKNNGETNLVKVEEVTVYYLSNSRKEQNNICFLIKADNKEIKEQINRIKFKLFYEGNSFDYISMFPPSISEEETIYICFSQDDMKKTKLDSIISSMEEVGTKDKIEITKDIIRNSDLYLFYDDNDSIRIPLDKNALFSFYLYDKSMKNVVIDY